jgi:hypothetical protein
LMCFGGKNYQIPGRDGQDFADAWQVIGARISSPEQSKRKCPYFIPPRH